MDLVSSGSRVVVTMEHCNKKGQSKILKQCTLPLTAAKCVSCIITDLAVFEVDSEGLLLTELAPGVSVDDCRAKTEVLLCCSCAFVKLSSYCF